MKVHLELSNQLDVQIDMDSEIQMREKLTYHIRGRLSAFQKNY